MGSGRGCRQRQAGLPVGRQPDLPIGRCQPGERGIPNETDLIDTRSALLKAARRLFAERGFYGASIAQIAEELGVTKQALLHHFQSKERLYGEVLSLTAQGLSRILDKAHAIDPDPTLQLEDLMVRLCANLFDYPGEAQLWMRELLDNRTRAEHARSWYLKGFLDALVALVRRTPGGRGLSEAEALSRVYLMLGAINFTAISEPTLKQMYPAVLPAMKAQLPAAIRRLVRGVVGPA